MRSLLILLLLSCFGSMTGQYSERFLEFSKSMTPVDSSVRQGAYSNGNPKYWCKTYIYETEEGPFEITVGDYKSYYRNGDLMSVFTYDDFGFTTKAIVYDSCGDLWKTYEAVTIDTEATRVIDLFEKVDLTNVTMDVKEYNCTLWKGTHHLWKEGQMYNENAVGTWKIYRPDGTLKKEKIY